MLLWCALIPLLSTAQVQARADGSRLRLPDTWEKTVGFLDWGYVDSTPGEILSNAANYAYVWSDLSWRPQLYRSGNPGIKVGRYIPSFLDQQNGRPEAYPDDDDTYDTPERRERTLLWWNTEVDGVGHPDWVLYQCDKSTPAFYVENDRIVRNMPLDFTNSDVIDWQIRTSTTGWDSSFDTISSDLFHLRNFDHACGIWRGGEWVQLFTGQDVDPLYAAAALEWARNMRDRLHALAPSRPLVVNLPVEDYYSAEEIAQVAENVDGINDEQGFTGYGLGREYCAEETWVRKITNMVAVQRMGRSYFSENYVHAFPPYADDIDWILSSFLMAKERAAYILMTINARPPEGVRWPNLAEMYDQDFGHPCADMQPEQNVYKRDYSKAMTVTNPSWDRTYVVNLPDGIFFDLYGVPVVGAIVLPPMTGKVLRTFEDRCP